MCDEFDHCVGTLSNKQYTYSIQKWYNNKTIESYQYGFEYYELSIPRELNQINFIYFRPCNYVNYIQVDLMYAGIASNVSKIWTQFTQTCKIFTRLQRIQNQLRLSYEEKINKSLGAINLLTRKNKQKRLIFSAIWHVFNIADYNKQKRLEEIVNNLDQDRITVAGQLNDMTFVITHQEEKIKQLQKSALQITELVKKY